MLELRCPACGRANTVLDDSALDRVRCAECAGALQRDTWIRYRVAGPGRGWGAQVHSDLLFRVSGGSLTPSMRLSEEGGPWFRAGEREDLFAAAPPTVRRTPAHAPSRGMRPLRVGRTRSAGVRRRVPDSVAAMASLCKLLGILILLLAVGGFFLAASFGAAGAGMTVFFVLIGLGWAQIAIGDALKRGAAAARAIQLGFAVLAGIIYLYGAGEGAGGPFLLLGGMFVAMPFLLLLNKEANAWFDGAR